MTPKSDANTAGSSTDDFESALQTLVLESFARGATVQGTWEVTSHSSVVPTWRITIEKTDGADPPADGSRFLDE